MSKKTLRDAPFSFIDLLKATGNTGTGYCVRGNEVRYACLFCDETFPQDDDGCSAMSTHEMEHGRAATCDISEIDGLRLRMVPVGLVSKYAGKVQPELWGVDDDKGLVYCLSNAYQVRTIWRWKLGACSGDRGGLSVAMLSAPACQ